MKILATEATLSTLKVEIKALTVSGKQMTLAVFRQLPVATLEQETVGRYWGFVRYSMEPNHGAHWLVLEFGGVLYRAPIYESELGDDLFTDLPQLFIAV